MTTSGSYLAAIDIGGTHIKTLLTTDGFEPLAEGIAVAPTGAGMTGMLGAGCAEVRRLLDERGLDAGSLAGVGVSSFGLIDGVAGKGIFSMKSDIAGVDMVGIVSHELGAPTLVGHDGHVAILGEHRFGAARGHSDVLNFVLGTGLATGIMIGGRVVTGARNVAGEFSHFVIESSGGLLCMCGRHGCAQVYLSETGVVAHARSLLEAGSGGALAALVAAGEPLSVRSVAECARAGDEAATQVIDRYIGYLASLVTSAITALNPGIVVIGGGISLMGDQLLRPLREQVRGQLLHESYECPIELAALGQQSGVYGAIALAAEAAGRPSAESSTSPGELAEHPASDDSAVLS